MKRIINRSAAVVALVVAAGLAVPAMAGADSTTTTTTTTSTIAASSEATSVWKSFHAEWKAYVDGLRSINATFRSSRDAALSVYESSLATATDQAERQAARTTYLAALSVALNARVTAITAAGDPPAPPAGYNGTAYVEGIQAANVAFRASVTAAQSAFATALAAATTPQEQREARLTYEAAIGNALVVRSNALLALGPPPAHPGQPSS